ncbi:MAG: helix-turn-helix domain-containing protein [Lachnospiraceae bacterium]|nr:helix-turn-helix domain-containing protein [Lachnospiraceae bacterium]
MGEYSKASIIKYTRKAIGMTQAELADQICDTVSLARYESGKVDPPDEKFARLMKKMGERGEIYLFPLRCDVPGIDMVMDKLLSAVEQYDWNQAEELMDILRNTYNLSMEYCENLQYIMRVENMINQRRKKISDIEALKRYEETLRLTFSDFDIEHFPERKVLSETELLLLFNIASTSGIIGDLDKALLSFGFLENYFSRKDMVDNSKPRYFIFLSYANLLGRIGRHRESIKICEREIQWLLRNNKVNYLYNFYFNIGWNINEEIRKGLERETNLCEAKAYIWLGYQLCKEYPENKRNLPIISEYYNHM